MLTKKQIIATIQQHYPELRARFGVRRIGLFGSCATQTQTDTSDIDLVADFETPPGLKFMDFADHMEGLLGAKTDILTTVGLNGIRNPNILASIKKTLEYV